MNLQPIYPARKPQELRLPKACTNCHGDVLTGTGFADLDGAPFKAYLCIACVTTYHMTSNKAHNALVDRDRRELASH